MFPLHFPCWAFVCLDGGVKGVEDEFGWVSYVRLGFVNSKICWCEGDFEEIWEFRGVLFMKWALFNLLSRI